MRIVTVSGTRSEVGKTGLVCALLERLPGWAAVKVTRGHYRSCGRDPETCCVSHLLGAEPRVFAAREETDVAGKDTGRFWAAGAAAVRWVVVRRGQEADGIRRALMGLADAAGILVEGNTVVRHLEPDLAVLVAGADGERPKPSAVRILDRIDALYLPEPAGGTGATGLPGPVPADRGWRVWGPADLDRIADRLR